MIELQEDRLQDLINSNERVIVQYGATWCGNCRIVKPKFKRLAGEHKDVTFVYVDAEQLPKSRELAQVRNLPTFAGFLNGELARQSEGNKVTNIEEILNEITTN